MTPSVAVRTKANVRTRAARSERRRSGSVAGLAAASYVPFLTGLVTGPLMARALGPSGRGEVAAVVVYATVLPFLYQLGLNAAITHFAARDPDVRPALFSSAIRWAAATVPAAIGMTAFLIAVPLAELPPTVKLMAALMLGTLSLGTLASLVEAFLIVEGALGPLARVQVLSIGLTGTAVVAMFVGGALTPVSYLAASLAAGVLANAFLIRLVRIRPRGRYPLRGLLTFGLKSFPAAVAGLANQRLDQMIIVPLLGTHDLGLYAVAVTIAGVPLGVTQALGKRAYGRMATDSPASLTEAARYLRLSLILSVGTAAAIAVAAPVLVPLLYGGAFADAVVPLLLLLPGTIALGVSSITRPALVLRGRPGIASLGELVALAVTAVGLSVLLPVLGIAGAGLVSSSSYVCSILIQVAALRRLGLRELVPRPADVSWLGRRLRFEVVRLVRPREAA